MRLDLALVEKKLLSTRTKAKAAVESGLVCYQGKVILKPSFDIQNLEALEIKGELMPYVSRGGLKLEKALHTFKINLKNKIVLDIGSSTGGFTDCALQHGAQHVIAIDVGKDQLDQKLQQNPSVTTYEQCDFRTIPVSKIQHAQIAVSDVSFISITKMLPKLSELPKLEAIVCLIKPQFECGKTIADQYKGIIKNKKIHAKILNKVLNCFQSAGFYPNNLTYSPICGARGNIEYLVYFEHIKSEQVQVEDIIEEAFQALK